MSIDRFVRVLVCECACGGERGTPKLVLNEVQRCDGVATNRVYLDFLYNVY